MSDDIRSRIKKNIVFIEPLLDIAKRGEIYQSDFLHCPHCHTFLAAGTEIKEFESIQCYKCKLVSKFISWAKSDERFYGPNYYKAGLAPIQ